MPEITETIEVAMSTDALWNEIGGSGVRLEPPSLPVRDYHGKLRIEPAGPNASRVTWSAKFDLADEGDGRTIESVRRFLHAGAESLGSRYHSKRD
jgi:hypothetical protein